MKSNTIAGFFLSAILGTLALTAAAQSTWPSRPVRLVLPFSAGGPGDVTSRIFAEALGKNLRQTLIIDNKPGAGGIIGSDFVAKSAPDGYTLLLAGNGAITNFLLRPKMPYTEADLIPLAMTNAAPSVMVVSAASGIRSLKDLQAYAKAHGDLTFADAGSGSTGHFVGQFVRQSLAVPVTVVHYKSGSESVTAVIGGQVAVASEAAIAVLPYIKSGKLVAIAVASDTRLAALPNVPSTTEQGFPEIQMRHWGGYFAPRGTPEPILDKLSAAIIATVSQPALQSEFEKYGYATLAANRADFARFLAAEKQRLAKIVASSGMTTD